MSNPKGQCPWVLTGVSDPECQCPRELVGASTCRCSHKTPLSIITTKLPGQQFEFSFGWSQIGGVCAHTQRQMSTTGAMDKPLSWSLVTGHCTIVMFTRGEIAITGEQSKSKERCLCLDGFRVWGSKALLLVIFCKADGI